jgi:hypothetical protein
MVFHYFDFDSVDTARAFMRAGQFPPPVAKPRGKKDSFDAIASTVAERDLLVLGWLRGADFKFLAVGLVKHAGTHYGDHVVQWLELPGIASYRRKADDWSWPMSTAFTLPPTFAVEVGLVEIAAGMTASPATRARREALREAMKLAHYTGTILQKRPRVCDILSRLRDDGFEVKPTGKERESEVNGTITVFADEMRIAYVAGDESKMSNLMGLPVRRGVDGEPKQPLVDDFDDASLDDFAKVLGVDRSHLTIHSINSKQRYIRVTDPDTAVQAVHALARLYKPDFRPTPIGVGTAGAADAALTDLLDDADARDAEMSDDEADVIERHGANSTEAQALIKARRGQGKYRESLLELFGNRCAVTGLALKQALRASHVKAWKPSTDAERLDPNNGLLLSATLDALFDRHLISFDREGKIMLAPLVAQYKDKHLLPLDDLLKRPTDAQYAYLRLHNAEFETKLKRWPVGRRHPVSLPEGSDGVDAAARR